MTSETGVNPEPLELEQQTAKPAILAARQELETAGITLVVMSFDGSGDEGINEDIKCYNSDSYDPNESDPVPHDTSGLQAHFEALVSLWIRTRVRRVWRNRLRSPVGQIHNHS